MSTAAARLSWKVVHLVEHLFRVECWLSNWWALWCHRESRLFRWTWRRRRWRQLVDDGATVEGVGYESWIGGAVGSTARFDVEVH